MNKKRILWTALLASLASAAALFLTLEAPGQAAPSQPSADIVGAASLDNSATNSALFPSCRFGVVASEDQLQQFDIVSNLGTGWYLNFSSAKTPSSATEAEYAQMIRLKQGAEARGGTDTCGPSYPFTITPALTDTVLGAYVDNNLGALWIIGNEPDRIGQDDVCPQQYAEAYHDAYHFIKGRDPTAQVAIAGLVEVTPGRLQYLDIVWDTYLEKYGAAMPVDVWTMHIYILYEHIGGGGAAVALGTDPSLAIPLCGFSQAFPPCYKYADHDNLTLFAEQAIRMRTWMKDHGQQNKPLILTEYSLIWPYHYYGTCSATTCPPPHGDGCFCDENNETFHPERVADYAEATFDYLLTATDSEIGYPADDYRLVQQWLWYSLATQGLDDLGHASNLVYTTTYTFTIPGQRWNYYLAEITPEVNLLPADVPVVTESAANGTDPVTATLSAVIVNNGNIPVTDTITVTFYSNAGLTTTIGTATVDGLGGCARRRLEVTTTWANLNSGAYPFWVKVDSDEVIAETKETDNVASGIVFVNPHQRFMPLILRD